MQNTTEKNITFYDTIFAALALELGLELRTFDKTQERLTKIKVETRQPQAGTI